MSRYFNALYLSRCLGSAIPVRIPDWIMSLETQVLRVFDSAVEWDGGWGLPVIHRLFVN